MGMQSSRKLQLEHATLIISGFMAFSIQKIDIAASQVISLYLLDAIDASQAFMNLFFRLRMAKI
jgi:hypothetical protein